MTKSRFGSYASFFSEQLAKTTSYVSQAVSSEHVEGVRNSLSHHYEKCQSNLREAAASSAVAQLKDNCSHYTGVAIKECAKLKDTVTQTVGQENIEKLSNQCGEYKKSISENYTYAKSKLNTILESEEMLRAKSVFDGSVNAVLSTNLIIDLGLSYIPKSGSLQLVLESSKYLATMLVFMISTSNSYHARKEDQDNHEKIGLYERDIDTAYEVTTQLYALCSSIEEMLSASNQSNDAAYITSKDFDLPAVDFKTEAKEKSASVVTQKMLLTSALDGAAKSSWMYYMAQCGFLLLPTTTPMMVLKALFVVTTMACATMSALNKNKIHAEDEAKLEILQKKLEPIYSRLLDLENKLSLNKDIILNKTTDSREEHKHDNASLNFDMKPIADGAAKATGLYLLIQTLVTKHNSVSDMIGLATLVLSTYDSFEKNHKQKDAKESFKEFALKMEKTKEITEKMKMLVDKQIYYEHYLKEQRLEDDPSSNKNTLSLGR